jgi:hypothetical protein
MRIDEAVRITHPRYYQPGSAVHRKTHLESKAGQERRRFLSQIHSQAQALITIKLH